MMMVDVISIHAYGIAVLDTYGAREEMNQVPKGPTVPPPLTWVRERLFPHVGKMVFKARKQRKTSGSGLS